MYRKLALTVAAAGALALAAPTTSANAGVFTGLKAPAVDSNTIDARCWHRRRWSGWRCHRRHHWHRHWRPHRHWRNHRWRSHRHWR